ncbi:MAG: discoidin domain-containing protein, partial [Phycisphaerae bacterium]|nr:discoidin domain-containing protein [Phycisphaerae bacterium]
CIHSLALRGDTRSIDTFIQTATSGQPDLACVAVLALSRFDDDKAADALWTVYSSARDRIQSEAASALLAVADRQRTQGQADKARTTYERLFSDTQPLTVRMAALQGLVSMGGEGGTTALFTGFAHRDPRMQAAALSALQGCTSIPVATIGAGFSKLPASIQPRVVLALAKRGQEARPLAVQAAQSGDPELRRAAAEVLGTVGDATCVGLLAEMSASGGKTAEAARASLVRLPDAGVNAAIVSEIRTAGPQVQVELVNALAGRGATETVSALLDLASGDDPQVRRTAFTGLRHLVGQEQARPLARLLVKGLEGTEAEQAEAATVAACRAIPDRAAQTSPVIEAYTQARSPRAKASLLRVLSALGGKEALGIVQAATREVDGAVRDAAVRALVEWPDAEALQPVRGLAESSQDPTHRILALRGFIRLIGLADLEEAEVFGLYDTAMRLSSRPEEKRLILAGITRLPGKAALTMARACLDDPAVASEARAAVQRIEWALKQTILCTASTEADTDKAVDGDPATRWTTGRPAQGGEWFLVDLGAERAIRRVVLDCRGSAEDYPRTYEVYLSNSRTQFGRPVAKGEGTAGLTQITFSRTRGRYLKIVQTGEAEQYWSIHEMGVE